MASETKKSIIESALKLFSKYNYHNVSMNQIAEGAEVSKGSLYWHFDSKEELFREILIDGIDYFNEIFKEIAAKNIAAEEKIYQLIEQVIKILYQNIDFITIFKNNINLINQEFEEYSQAKHQENIDALTRIIDEGIESGLFVDQDSENISLMILSLLFSDQIRFLLLKEHQKENKIEEQIDFIYNFILNGICRRENGNEK